MQAKPEPRLFATSHWIVHMKHIVLLWVASTCQACKCVYFAERYTILIGAVHISLSSTMLRPNTLPFSDSTPTWAATLAESPEVPTDPSVALLIQYQRLLECVFDLYREERKTNDWPRTAMHAKRMAAMLESWWVTVPPHLHLARMNTLLAIASNSLIDDRSFRQQILLRKNTYLRDGPVISLSDARRGGGVCVGYPGPAHHSRGSRGCHQELP